MNNTIKFQNYSHYKLPITFNPLNYGKLFEQIGSKFILQLITRNIVIINQTDNTNFVRLYRNGDLMLEWKDIKISETSFTRILFDHKFTYENDRLVSTEILSTTGKVLIYSINNENLNKKVQLMCNISFMLFNKYFIGVYHISFMLFTDILRIFVTSLLCYLIIENL